ncbi:MAG: ABC transporter ATP-binding protein [Prevotella sp.]|nr:ABC transporter ATP-binding protein [Prevotella sp.]
MISIHNLHKRYGRLHALRDVNLQLNDGECVAFIGPNGCGKTTLMKCILGLVRPQAGQVLIDGLDAASQPQCRERIGFMPQKSSFPDNMTVGQAVGTLLSVRRRHADLDLELYHQFGIAAMADKRCGALSGGTSQKVSAAMAFLFNPRMLMLDEPVASLDPLASETLKEKLRQEKAKGKLIVITSHILSELEGLATRIVFMDEGCVLFHHTVEELQQLTGEPTITKSITRILSDHEAHRQNHLL